MIDEGPGHLLGLLAVAHRPHVVPWVERHHRAAEAGATAGHDHAAGLTRGHAQGPSADASNRVCTRVRSSCGILCTGDAQDLLVLRGP